MFETASPGRVETSEADPGEEDEDEVEGEKETNDELEDIEGDDEEELDEEDGELDEDDEEEELNIGRSGAVSRTSLRASQGKKFCRKGKGENKGSIYDLSCHAKSLLQATGTVQWRLMIRKITKFSH